MPEQGDIVLIPIPFTDLSSHKRWPVIVISNNEYNRETSDIVVVAMTSNPITVEYGFTITSSSENSPHPVAERLPSPKPVLSEAEGLGEGLGERAATSPPFSFIVAVPQAGSVSSDLDIGTLNRPSKVRVDKIYTLAQAISIKTFGRVNNNVLDRIQDLLQQLTADKSENFPPFLT